VPGASIYHATTTCTNWVILLCHAMQVSLKDLSAGAVFENGFSHCPNSYFFQCLAVVNVIALLVLDA
jgi:hypothetical protein